MDELAAQVRRTGMVLDRRTRERGVIRPFCPVTGFDRVSLVRDGFLITRWFDPAGAWPGGSMVWQRWPGYRRHAAREVVAEPWSEVWTGEAVAPPSRSFPARPMQASAVPVMRRSVARLMRRSALR